MGRNALLSNVTGSGNIAVGFHLDDDSVAWREQLVQITIQLGCDEVHRSHLPRGPV
jgi:hypothetical protein